MKADLYNQQAKKLSKSVDLDDSVFASKVNEKLLSTYTYIYLSNQRQSNAHTKDRSEVSGGGRKPWAQKGTGRARVGSNRSPIWTKGGVTFGPRNERNFKRILPKKAKQAAFRSVFSQLALNNNLVIVDKFDFEPTRLANQASKIAQAFAARKITVVTAQKDENTIRAFSNIPSAKVKMISEISVYDLMTGGKILLAQDCLSHISDKWGKVAKESK
jgi:large subunit ribosomal protein L4